VIQPTLFFYLNMNYMLDSWNRFWYKRSFVWVNYKSSLNVILSLTVSKFICIVYVVGVKGLAMQIDLIKNV